MLCAAFAETWTSGNRLFSAANLFSLASGMGADEPFSMLYGDGNHGRFLVWGDTPLAVLDSPDSSGIAIERSGDIPPILPDFIGHATYEWGTARERLVPNPPPDTLPLPRFHFTLYAHVLVYDSETSTLHECTRRIAGKRGSVSAAADAPKGSPSPVASPQNGFRAKKTFDSDDPGSYADKVAAIRAEIASGNVYQANLTREEEWSYAGNLVEFAKRLYAENPAPFSAFIRNEKWAIVSSSPERLVKIGDGRLEARPIKGTSPRGKTEKEDETLAAGLLASGKNRAELAMIVDLLRNDLTRCCVLPSVSVEEFPILETYANVHHLVATVSGKPRPDLTLDELLYAIFPGGSVTGCPKIAAMQIISRLEARPRGAYTGLLGWFAADMTMLDFNIPIRTVWADDGRLRFGTGGAVVWDSDPAEEYLETVHKAESIVRCLEGRQKCSD